MKKNKNKEPEQLSEMPYEEKVVYHGRPFVPFWWTYPSDYVIEPHFHDGLELVCYAETDGETVVGGRQFPISDQCAFWIAPNAIHSFRIRRRSAKSCVAGIKFNLLSISDYIRNSCGMEFNELVRSTSRAPVVLAGKAGQEVRNVLQSFEVSDAGVYLEDQPLDKAFEMLSVICRILARGMENLDESMEQVTDEPRVREIMKIIMDSASEKLPLDDLAKRTALSKSYLCRFFKRHTHMTIQEYLTRVRISRAKQLMRDKGKTVTQTCFECGFSSLSYFISVFSKMTGTTPKQWAKTYTTG